MQWDFNSCSGIDNFVLNGISLRCQLIVVEQVAQVQFEGVTIGYNVPKGCISVTFTTIYINHSTISVPLCAFQSNITITSSTLQQITGLQPPIQATDCTISLHNTSLAHNIGGLDIHSSEANLNMTHFYDNSADSSTGIISINNSHFVTRNLFTMLENTGYIMKAIDSMVNLTGCTDLSRNQ